MLQRPGFIALFCTHEGGTAVAANEEQHKRTRKVWFANSSPRPHCRPANSMILPSARDREPMDAAVLLAVRSTACNRASALFNQDMACLVRWYNSSKQDSAQRSPPRVVCWPCDLSVLCCGSAAL